MKKLILLMLCGLPIVAFSQNKLYLNLNSHNEMTGENYDTDSLHFDSITNYTRQIALSVVAKNAKWDFQTCSKYVLAVIKYEHGDTSSTDILEWMNSTGQIQIDPRPKKQPPLYTYNIADVVTLLDSVGVPDSRTVGGFIYYPYAAEDWTEYLSPVIGTHYGRIWTPRIIWGAGSNPPHTHDAHNFGIWKPLGATDSISFYTHSPTTPIWIEGNGCSAVLYDTTNPIDVFNTVKDVAQKISTGYWPTDRFYSMSVMINQRDFSAAFVTKVNQLLDSINTLVASNQVVWTTIQEKFDTFQTWCTATSHTYSQWECNESPLFTEPIQQFIKPVIYPNPANDLLFVDNVADQPYHITDVNGVSVQTGSIIDGSVNIASIPPGFYVLNINSEADTKRLKFIHR